MSEIITVGLDLAKNVFQVHGADAAGRHCQLICPGRMLPDPRPSGGHLECVAVPKIKGIGVNRHAILALNQFRCSLGVPSYQDAAT